MDKVLQAQRRLDKKPAGAVSVAHPELRAKKKITKRPSGVPRDIDLRLSSLTKDHEFRFSSMVLS